MAKPDRMTDRLDLAVEALLLEDGNAVRIYLSKHDLNALFEQVGKTQLTSKSMNTYRGLPISETMGGQPSRIINDRGEVTPI